MEEVVTLQLEAPLALVTLNRPKSLNALNSEVYRQLIAIQIGRASCRERV